MRTTPAALALALALVPWVGGSPAAAAPPGIGGARVDLAGEFTTVTVQVDPGASALRGVRTAEGEAPATSQTPVAGRSTVVLRTGSVVLGRAYTYELSLVDASGTAGPSTRVPLVATSRPVPSVPSLASERSSDTRFHVGIDGVGNASDSRYQIFYRPLPGRWTEGSESIRPWVLDAGATGRHFFGGPARPGSLATRSTQGESYEFIGVVRDRFGNRGEARSGRVVVPVDDPSTIVTGRAVRMPRASAWGGASTLLQAAGAQATRVVSGERVGILAERCPMCGVVDLLLDGARVARVDTRSSLRTARNLVADVPLGLPRGRTAVLTVRAVGTPGRPSVVLDAVVVTRAVAGAPRDGLGPGDQLVSGPAGMLASSLTSERFTSPGGVLAPTGQTVLQADGNLVTYAYADQGRTRRAVFQSRTREGARLAVQRDSNVVLYSAAGRALWQTGTQGQGAVVLVQQGDGNLVVRRARDGAAVWSARR